jgi:putative phosphoribosyl transferase
MEWTPVFRDRRDAGRQLASRLGHCARESRALVLALPRGGVPVAFEVAEALGAPLDVLVVRKLGIPGHKETAMGAVGPGAQVLDRALIEDLGIAEQELRALIAREERELARREQLYRGQRAPLEARGRTAIVVDDGLATGASMRVAIKALHAFAPARIVVAAPVAASDTATHLRAEVDEVVCVLMPEPFHAVGYWYANFSQTTDEEVRDLLAQNAARIATSPPRA